MPFEHHVERCWMLLDLVWTSKFSIQHRQTFLWFRCAMASILNERTLNYTRPVFTKIPPPTLFSSLSRIPLLSRKYRSKKSPVAANANRCRLAVSIELYLSVMKWRENRSGRNEEGRVSSLSRLSQPWPPLFFFLLTFLWAFERLYGAVVCDRKNRWLAKTMTVWFKGTGTVRHMLSLADQIISS